ncbi:hypothetical protein BDQ17DRAFT_1427629 [Cyathus striatus]|nr:hypothetical protein BDQ17DRAFT_1427629 [Cyathus striatus]
MQRILEDPSGEVCPNYRNEEYEEERTLLIGDEGAPAMMEDQAVEKLEKIWQIKHQKKVTAWNAQVNEVNEGRRQEEWQRHQSPSGNETESQSGCQHGQRQASVGQYRTEEEDTNVVGRQGHNTEPKTRKRDPCPFDAEWGIATIPFIRPAQYAIDKINARGYVEMIISHCKDAAWPRRTPQKQEQMPWD